jgi:hypothetical protein
VSGRLVVIGLLAFAVIFGAGLWYAQVYAFFTPVEGVTRIRIAGESVPVSEYRGVDGTSSPLKLRGCFRVDPASVKGPVADDPTPLTAPFWFDCFDAGAIGGALERGEARAVLAARDEPPGFSRMIAVFPDGRAYQWRQSELE